MCTLKQKSAEAEDLLKRPTGIEALGEMLSVMNPYPFGNLEGICDDCAFEVANVLTQGRRARPLFDSRDQSQLMEMGEGFRDGRGADKKFAIAPGRAQVVWDWLTASKRPFGKVFIAEGGGHVWNFLKDFSGRIYVIDMSQRLCRQVKGPNDAKVRYWWALPWKTTTPPGTPVDLPLLRAEIADAGMMFNYLDPTKLGQPNVPAKLAISQFAGILSANWAALLRVSSFTD